MPFVLVFVCFMVELTNLEHLFLINCQTWVIMELSRRRFLGLGVAGGLALTVAPMLPGCKFNYDVEPEEVRHLKDGIVSIEFVIDTSGSMGDFLGHDRKMDSAKEALEKTLRMYKDHHAQYGNLELGLVAFDSGVDLLVPICEFDYSQLSEHVNDLGYGGCTSLGKALAQAQQDLNENAHGRRNIILLTDGKNTCGKTPEEIYGNIQKYNFGDHQTSLYVVMFDTDPQNFEGLRRLGAKPVAAANPEKLSEVLFDTASGVLEKPVEYKKE
ncbi:hypothetical protein COV17_00265 [Candidatus Woesearchaeota archaeon CG10_big_fil_rev_8_21_14_0_10_36_11]|nr:MAG: hypothetical protein COV17_00265 [Candidatus Woesearchaeota archaeon CG10_big_fil_rev_8_21_14_0_10_36_11]